MRANIPLQYGALRVLQWTCDDGVIGVVPFLEALHLESRLGQAVVTVVVVVRGDRCGALGLCWYKGARVRGCWRT